MSVKEINSNLCLLYCAIKTKKFKSFLFYLSIFLLDNAARDVEKGGTNLKNHFEFINHLRGNSLDVTVVKKALLVGKF